MLYHDLEDLGLQKYDFRAFFGQKNERFAVIVDTTHDPHGAVLGARLLNELALKETFRSGFLHYAEAGEVRFVRFRVDAIHFSALAHEQSFVVIGHVHPDDWDEKAPDLRSHKDIGYKQPALMSASDFFCDGGVH